MSLSQILAELQSTTSAALNLDALFGLPKKEIIDNEKVFAKCVFLAIAKSNNVKRLLEEMQENIIPHLPQPFLLLDFLTKAYDEAGCE